MICLNNISKKYGQKVVYKNFSMQVNAGETVCILGESGCGKSTLLNIIASLIEYEGEVLGVDKVSYLFQDHCLLPNLTVKKNLLLVCKDEIQVDNWIEKVKMKGKENKYPKELSGGEKQRVAIARAFLYNGDIFLLDEPFSSLDIKIKIELLDEFKKYMKELKKTTLYVTHSIEEALYVGDRIIFLKNGEILSDLINVKTINFFDDSPTKSCLQKLYFQ